MPDISEKGKRSKQVLEEILVLAESKRSMKDYKSSKKIQQFVIIGTMLIYQSQNIFINFS